MMQTKKNKYDYLRGEPKKNSDGAIDLSCTNYFIPLEDIQIETAEKIIGMKFPSELREFYQEIGFGFLSTPHNPPDDYSFCNRNLILHPLAIARFKKGNLLNKDLDSYMSRDTHELLAKDDLPFFEIGDSSSFMIMKPKSDNPNAVWYMGMEKIEDSLEQFIHNLYYKNPAYYADPW